MTRMTRKIDPSRTVQCVLDAIESGAGEEAVFDCLAYELRQMMDFDLAALEWVDGENAVVGAVYSKVATELYVGKVYPIAGTATGWVVEHREPVVEHSGRGLFSFGRHTPATGGIRSTILVPLLSNNAVAGIIRLASVRRKAFKRQQAETLRELLTRIGGALVSTHAGKTDRGQYEQLHREQRERLLLINTLAHELKTPLTAVVASGGLLVEELQTDERQELRKLAENIVRAAGKLEARLAELVELAKSERTGISIEMELVDIRPLLENAAAVFRPVTASRHQTLVLDLAENVPLVMADRQRIEQVVMNLLSNASKFTQNGGRIWLILTPDDRRLVVKVRDNGPGISAEEQERIFRPYYRVEADRQRFEGLGLGLALCKQIVTAHGGNIWVESRPGEGSTFSFSLPVAEVGKIPARRETPGATAMPPEGKAENHPPDTPGASPLNQSKVTED